MIEGVKTLFGESVKACRKSNVWLMLGWLDIKQKYVGSVLGPIWITFSLLIFLVSFSVVYSKIFHQPLQTYVPFLTAGFLVWGYIAAVIIDSADVFYINKPYIYQMKLPLPLYVLKMLWKNIIIFLHNFVVYAIVCIIFRVDVSKVIYAVPMFALLTLMLYFVSLLLAVIGTRYRDIPPILSSIIQVLFFVTPVTWVPHLVGKSSYLVKYNPFYHMLEIVRQPLLGGLPTLSSIDVVICLLLACALLVTAVYSKSRKLIPYWL